MTPKTYANFLETNMEALQKDHDNEDRIKGPTLDKNIEEGISDGKDKDGEEMSNKASEEGISKATYRIEGPDSVMYTPRSINESSPDKVSGR